MDAALDELDVRQRLYGERPPQGAPPSRSTAACPDGGPAAVAPSGSGATHRVARQDARTSGRAGTARDALVVLLGGFGPWVAVAYLVYAAVH